MNRFTTSHENFKNWRMLFVYGIMVLVFGFYLWRLFDLQVVQGSDYLARANENRTTIISVPTQRGLIYDRNGVVLARNVAAYNVEITPANLPPTDDLASPNGEVQEVYRKVSELIGVPVSKGTTDENTVKSFKPCDNDLGITQIVYIQDTNAPYDPVRIKCDIDEKTAMIIQERSADLPGVGIEIQPVRDYPTGNLTAEIIGFLGPIPATEADYYKGLGFQINRDKIGYAGVEQSLNDGETLAAYGIPGRNGLMGINGQREVEVDVAGKELRDLQQPKPAVPGDNIVLTIDTRLQAVARAALISGMNKWNAKFPAMGLNTGVVIAMNPKTGEILALVSLPNYENNRMARLIPAYYYNELENDPTTPLFNHAISAEYPPGSVFKMGTALGILNEGVVTPDQKIMDPGMISLENKYSVNEKGLFQDYFCWNRAGHGLVDYLHGIAESCDVYFYKVGGGYQNEVPNGLGILRIGQYAKALGYGVKTGIELPGESTGLIPDPDWKRQNQGENWSTGDTYIATIGQGYVLSTPLQVLRSIATIANDGKLMKPTLIKRILDSEGHVVQTVQPKQVWDITKDPVITVYDQNGFPTDQKKTVEPWIVQLAKQGMRMVVTEGTAKDIFTTGGASSDTQNIPSAGKTGTAEYCDDVARAKNRCKQGNWPAHAWYVGYAPYDNPEIAVVAFVYNGNEGSTVAAPIAKQVLDAYFELKSIDAYQQNGATK